MISQNLPALTQTLRPSSVAQVASVWGQGHFLVLLSLAVTVCLTILLHGSCTETGQCPPLWYHQFGWVQVRL